HPGWCRRCSHRWSSSARVASATSVVSRPYPDGVTTSNICTTRFLKPAWRRGTPSYGRSIEPVFDHHLRGRDERRDWTDQAGPRGGGHLSGVTDRRGRFLDRPGE